MYNYNYFSRLSLFFFFKEDIMTQHHTLCSSLHVQLVLANTYHTVGPNAQRSDGGSSEPCTLHSHWSHRCGTGNARSIPVCKVLGAFLVHTEESLQEHVIKQMTPALPSNHSQMLGKAGVSPNFEQD